MQGIVCGVWGVICGVWDMVCRLRGAGCEMLSLILELQTCQLGLFSAHVVMIH